VRWGGEEFLALLPGIDESGLAAVAERVRMLVENSWIQQGETQVRVTVSVGATMAVPAESPEDVADRADRLMYASKRAGRNRVTTDAGRSPAQQSGPSSGPLSLGRPPSVDHQAPGGPIIAAGSGFLAKRDGSARRRC